MNGVTQEEYGMIMSSILTKLALGMPLGKEESQVMYEFVMGLNNNVGILVNMVEKQQAETNAYKRLYLRNKRGRK